MEALFLLSFVGFLELFAGAHSFSINATKVCMDCNASASSAFGGVEVVWSSVGVASIRGGVGGLRVCASFGLLLVVLECCVGLDSPSRRWVCDDASRMLFCCTRTNVSFLFANAGSISRVMTSGCPLSASCIVHILISCSIAHNSCVACCMCLSTLSESAIGLSCTWGVLRCFGC